MKSRRSSTWSIGAVCFVGLRQRALCQLEDLTRWNTEAECAAAGAELDALMKAHEQDRNAVTETSIRKAKAVLAEQQVELEQAKTMLDHQLQRAKKPE